MTFTELFAALALSALFLSGLASAALPALEADARAERLRERAFETGFVIDGFRAACRSGPSAFPEWKRAVQAVRGLGEITLRECPSPAAAKTGMGVWLLSVSVGGERVNVYAEGPLP